MKNLKVSLPRIPKGYQREYLLCKHKGCGNVFYYDFIPYSLANPIITSPCHTRFGGLTSFEGLNATAISKKEFYERLRKNHAKKHS